MRGRAALVAGLLALASLVVASANAAFASTGGSGDAEAAAATTTTTIAVVDSMFVTDPTKLDEPTILITASWEDSENLILQYAATQSPAPAEQPFSGRWAAHGGGCAADAVIPETPLPLVLTVDDDFDLAAAGGRTAFEPGSYSIVAWSGGWCAYYTTDADGFQVADDDRWKALKATHPAGSEFEVTFTVTHLNIPGATDTTFTGKLPVHPQFYELDESEVELERRLLGQVFLPPVVGGEVAAGEVAGDVDVGVGDADAGVVGAAETGSTTTTTIRPDDEDDETDETILAEDEEILRRTGGRDAGSLFRGRLGGFLLVLGLLLGVAAVVEFVRQLLKGSRPTATWQPHAALPAGMPVVGGAGFAGEQSRDSQFVQWTDDYPPGFRTTQECTVRVIEPASENGELARIMFKDGTWALIAQSWLHPLDAVTSTFRPSHQLVGAKKWHRLGRHKILAAPVDDSGTHTLFDSGQQVQVVRSEGGKTLVRTGPKQQVWVKSEYVEPLPSQRS